MQRNDEDRQDLVQKQQKMEATGPHVYDIVCMIQNHVLSPKPEERFMPPGVFILRSTALSLRSKPKVEI